MAGDAATPSKDLISSVEVRLDRTGHDVVRVWNRGGLAGELVVVKGDGIPVYQRLVTDGPAAEAQRDALVDAIARFHLTAILPEGELASLPKLVEAIHELTRIMHQTLQEKPTS